MSCSKSTNQEHTLDPLREELKELKSSNRKDIKALREIARSAISKQQYDLAEETFQFISDENERNLLIADLIEILLSSRKIEQARKFAKYLTPEPEIQPLMLIRIALVEGDNEQAEQIAEQLPSPLSRNFALIHIAEAYLANEEKNKVRELNKQILENVKTIYDAKSRSFILRSIAIDLYMANHEKELAKQAAMLIPDEAMRALVIKKLG